MQVIVFQPTGPKAAPAQEQQVAPKSAANVQAGTAGFEPQDTSQRQAATAQEPKVRPSISLFRKYQPHRRMCRSGTISFGMQCGVHPSVCLNRMQVSRMGLFKSSDWW